MQQVFFPARAIPWPMVGLGLLALLGFWALAVDQGQLLSVWQGDAAYQVNMLHELVHDARHAAGFPCH